MSFGLRARLSLMMFLQYFVWGIWLPMLAQHVGPNGLNLGDRALGWILMVYGLGSIIGPFILGQLADRFFATEKVLAFAHLVGGGMLIATAYATTFWPIFIMMLLYCHLYMPTIGLTNSLSFRALGEENQAMFPSIRVWGTVGWIAAGLFFASYLEYESFWPSSVLPMWQSLFNLSFVGEPAFRDCLRLSGFFSVLYGIYCLTLPHTPPAPAKETDPIDKKSAMLETLELMKFRSFAVLIVIAALIGILLAFFFAAENYFLEAVGVAPKQIGAYMTISQFAEAAVVLLIPLSVAKLGYKTTMLIGLGAWAARFGLSAIGYPKWLMISTLGLHGFAFGFFFIVAQMFVDRAASKDIKASAQSLLIFVIYGLGTVAGSLIAGETMHYFHTGEGPTGHDWRAIWAGPFVLTLICMAAFALLFKEQQIGEIREDADAHGAPSVPAH
ncbi:MFS transporter [Paludisphaera sp.]|uniref:MFS transporter n=1 Tax=Paludisphaera sp. TaxID=2017432 RepID=UPI00301E0116